MSKCYAHCSCYVHQQLLAAYLQVHPVKGNVAFSAATAGWSFTLKSFAQLYVTVYQTPLDVNEMAKRLWGDVYFHPTTRTFRKKPPAADGEPLRSFVQFVLEPLYKIYSQVRLASLCCIYHCWLLFSSLKQSEIVGHLARQSCGRTDLSKMWLLLLC